MPGKRKRGKAAASHKAAPHKTKKPARAKSVRALKARTGHSAHSKTVREEKPEIARPVEDTITVKDETLTALKGLGISAPKSGKGPARQKATPRKPVRKALTKKRQARAATTKPVAAESPSEQPSLSEKQIDILGMAPRKGEPKPARKPLPPPPAPEEPAELPQLPAPEEPAELPTPSAPEQPETSERELTSPPTPELMEAKQPPAAASKTPSRKGRKTKGPIEIPEPTPATLKMPPEPLPEERQEPSVPPLPVSTELEDIKQAVAGKEEALPKPPKPPAAEEVPPVAESAPTDQRVLDAEALWKESEMLWDELKEMPKRDDERLQDLRKAIMLTPRKDSPLELEADLDGLPQELELGDFQAASLTDEHASEFLPPTIEKKTSEMPPPPPPERPPLTLKVSPPPAPEAPPPVPEEPPHIEELPAIPEEPLSMDLPAPPKKRDFQVPELFRIPQGGLPEAKKLEELAAAEKVGQRLSLDLQPLESVKEPEERPAKKIAKGKKGRKAKGTESDEPPPTSEARDDAELMKLRRQVLSLKEEQEKLQEELRETAAEARRKPERKERTPEPTLILEPTPVREPVQAKPEFQPEDHSHEDALQQMEQSRLQEQALRERLVALANDMRQLLDERRIAEAGGLLAQIKDCRRQLGHAQLGDLEYDLVTLETDLKLAHLG